MYDTPKSYSFRLYAGQYTVHLYGGQGGHSYDGGKLSRIGGKGAYVKGTMKVTGTGTLFYAYVGGQGSWPNICGPNNGGFNGGGSGGKDTTCGDGKNDVSGGGGGGSTDLRIFSANVSNRIIVAAGGSGATGTCGGSPGGELSGFYATSNDNFAQSSEVTQTKGVENGAGQNGVDHEWNPGSGGGGGWRGGIRTTYEEPFPESYRAVAHSGSSYISGYSGCTANTDMSFTGGYMESGVNEGNGKIEIIYDFVCSSNCIDCINSSMCTECQSGYVMFYNNTCQRTCPAGYVIVNSRCYACSTGCSRCSTTTSHCEACKAGYYYYDNYCYAECYILNDELENTNKHFGFDRKTMTCKECADENCLRCDNNYAICELCAFKFHIENGKCIHDPTTIFTPSNLFTETNQFSYSSNFSYSAIFSQSNKFTESEGFSQSHEFSLSTEFSSSVGFTKTEIFSDSTAFSLSDGFSKSAYFSSSFEFSSSASFSESIEFSYSNDFSISQVFSNSLMFSGSNVFSKTVCFTNSEFFSNSNNFSQSNIFNFSSVFSFSEYFSKSFDFLESKTLFPQVVLQSKNRQAIILGISFTILGIIFIAAIVLLIIFVKKRNETISDEINEYEQKITSLNIAIIDSNENNTN